VQNLKKMNADTVIFAFLIFIAFALWKLIDWWTKINNTYWFLNKKTNKKS